MVAKSKNSKGGSSSETSASIANQIDAFLQSGGEIQKINTGVSGQQSVSGPKHITLGNKPRT